MQPEIGPSQLSTYSWGTGNISVTLFLVTFLYDLAKKLDKYKTRQK